MGEVLRNYVLLYRGGVTIPNLTAELWAYNDEGAVKKAKMMIENAPLTPSCWTYHLYAQAAPTKLARLVADFSAKVVTTITTDNVYPEEVK